MSTATETTKVTDPRVRAGAAWLDTIDPNWASKIDLSTFDMRDSCLCVLGQVFAYAEEFDDDDEGAYGYGLELLHEDEGDPLGYAHGFDKPYDPTSANMRQWRALQDEWLLAIGERR
jgi:hypothetical protein